MKTKLRHYGFTIIELLVVVSIIGLLLSLLIPAVGKARESALTTQSLANLRNMSSACASYGADWTDRQPTYMYDEFAQHITALGPNATSEYQSKTGSCPPSLIVGWGGYVNCNAQRNTVGIWAYWTPCDAAVGTSANYCMSLPFLMSGQGWGGATYATSDGYGAWRYPNARNFSQYISNRYYDKVFYAPKDKYSMELAQPAFESPDDFVSIGCNGGSVDSTYCFSPAAMFSPDAFSHKNGCLSFAGKGLPPAIFRSPSVGQASFPDLKTRMIEHSWLQNKEGPDFNPKFGDIPYFFNQCINSSPATLFFDGHCSLSGCNDSMDANARVTADKVESNSTDKEKGLFASSTLEVLPGPWGKEYGGYFTGPDGKDGANFNYDTQVNTSFHVFTVDGILGRDFVSAK